MTATMQPELHDGVVVLRPLTVADALQHKAGEDEAQIRWFEFPGAAPLENVVAAIQSWEDAWAAGGPVRNFGVWDQLTGALIGNVEAHEIRERTVNISYVVFPPWRRRGIATRAVRLVTAYAAEHMHAHTAEFKILPDNHASLAVARRVGAEEIGRVRGDTGSDFALFRLALAAGEKRGQVDQPK